MVGQQKEAAAGIPAIGCDAEGRGTLAAVPAVPLAPESAVMHAEHNLSQTVQHLTVNVAEMGATRYTRSRKLLKHGDNRGPGFCSE